MVDNRYATALVIGSVLSLLATVYLSVAVGTQHWYQYNSPPGKHEGSNTSEFNNERFDEKIYSDILFRCNGTLGLWWRCIQVTGESMWFSEPGMTCVHTIKSALLPPHGIVEMQLSLYTFAFVCSGLFKCSKDHKRLKHLLQSHTAAIKQIRE